MNPEEFTRFVYWIYIIVWILVGITFCAAATWGILAIFETIKHYLEERRH